MSEKFETAIKDNTAIVGVVGLGYVGLPLVQVFAEAGFRCMGFDVDESKISTLREGKSYIGHIESDWIEQFVKAGTFEPTADMARLTEPDAILICVPTPLNESREPDLRYITSTAERIQEVLRPGQLIILESTTYPTTTRDVVKPILEKSGLVAGKDFYLAYSPEREDPGNANFGTKTIPKVVGGLEEISLRLASQLYGKVVKEVVPVSSCEVAEACKILENTYRAVNIAMVNELKRLFTEMDIDVWEVIEAAKTKPFGYQAFYPGPGLGGHCIPIDPFYLSWIARKMGMSTRFIELAGEINTAMPKYVIERIAAALNKQGKPIQGSKICILGIAYKPDVEDPRESPSFELMKLLREWNADLTYNDPLIPELPKMRHYNNPDMISVELTPKFLALQDAVVIATNHSAYDYQFIVENSQLVIDTRGATDGITSGRNKICKA